VDLDFGGLQAGGSAGDFAADLQGAGGLERDAAAPGLGFETQLPSAGSGLLNAAGDVGEGEGPFFFTGLEIDAAIIKIRFFAGGCGVGGALRAIGSHCGGSFD